MNTDRLIEALARPAAFPFPVDAVEVRQTHISVVFLAGAFVYKVKKPVSFGFLDFASPEARRHFCEREVTLNRRLAPDIYLGVVPIVAKASGLAFEGDGPVVEWAVKMRRLPDDATLLARLDDDRITAADAAALGARVAAFHASAAGGEHVASFARFETVAANALDNFTQSESHVGRTISQVVFGRLRTLTRDALGQLQPLIERRADRGVPRDTHGDLRPDHVYHFPDRPPPGDIVIIDCIEFNDRFRYADPVADMAFLAMELGIRGRPDLATAFADAYFRAANDPEGRSLLPFYSAYRAAVRGKVEGLVLGEAEVPGATRATALRRARAYWLFALGTLEPPARRPCLVLVGGLPGTGKSTVARGLASRAGFRVIRSDVVRKELAGLSPDTPAAGAIGGGIYRPEFTERTYTECLRLAEEMVFAGDRVIVDASFGRESHRRAFLDAAARLGVPGIFLHCHAPTEVTRARLSARHGDASDADWEIHQHAAALWEPAGPRTRTVTRPVPTAEGTPDQVTDLALAALRTVSLVG